MFIYISRIVVTVIGLAICALSVWGIVVPGKLIRIVKSVMGQPMGILAAVVVRLLLGAALIFVAPAAKFPLVLEILGWIAIAAAVGLAILGRQRLLRFVGWYERISPALLRIWLLFGVAFGAFLAYAVH